MTRVSGLQMVNKHLLISLTADVLAVVRYDGVANAVRPSEAGGAPPSPDSAVGCKAFPLAIAQCCASVLDRRRLVCACVSTSICWCIYVSRLCISGVVWISRIKYVFGPQAQVRNIWKHKLATSVYVLACVLLLHFSKFACIRSNSHPVQSRAFTVLLSSGLLRRLLFLRATHPDEVQPVPTLCR